MKLKVEYSAAKNDPGDEYENSCTISLDGSQIANGGNFCDCPEDANMGRDLKFVYKLPDVLRRVHEAGRAGEPLEIEEVENAD